MPNIKWCPAVDLIEITIVRDYIIIFQGCCVYSKPLAYFPIEDFNAYSGNLELLHKLCYTKKPIYENFKPREFRVCNAFDVCPSKTEIKNIKVNLPSCNLRCKYCIIGGSDAHTVTEKEVDAYFNILNLYKGHNLSEITLTATGEPFFYKKRIFEYILSLRGTDTKKLKIITNATLLNEDDIKLLASIKEIELEIIVSLDSLNKETYEKIRIGGNFDTVINNVYLLKKYNLLSAINMVILEDNIDELDDFYKFSQETDIIVEYIIEACNNKKSDSVQMRHINEKIISDPRYIKFYESHPELLLQKPIYLS